MKAYLFDIEIFLLVPLFFFFNTEQNENMVMMATWAAVHQVIAVC